MKVITEGYCYELASLEGTAPQVVEFIESGRCTKVRWTLSPSMTARQTRKCCTC